MKPRIALGLGAAALLIVAAAARFPSFTEEIKPTLRSLSALTGARTGPGGAARLQLPQATTQAESLTSVDLVAVPWRHASTGWLALADYDTPLADYSFVWGPLVVAGERFSRGYGTYPLSEIVYDLDPGAVRFGARVGVTDDSKNGAGSVRFAVYGDEFLLYESGIVRAGERARAVDVGVEGLSELRLVVDDAEDGSLGDFALWAEPRLAISPSAPSGETLAEVERARRQNGEHEAARREAQRAELRAWVAPHTAAVERLGDRGHETRAAFDPESALLVAANDLLAVTVGHGGTGNGRLTLSVRGEDVPRIVGATAGLVLPDGSVLRLADTVPVADRGFEIERVNPPTLGPGAEVHGRFRVPGGTGVITVSITLFDGQSAVDFKVTTEGLRLRAVRYLDGGEEAVVLGDHVHYLTDRSHLYRGRALADGYVRWAPLETTKPALIWDEGTSRGLLLSVFDYTPSPAWLSIERGPGREALAVGLELEATLGDFGADANLPPALSIEATDAPIGAGTFSRFRRIVAERYPVSAWPSSARYQWGSWYAYGPGITETALLREIDQLASWFGDLGPWQFFIDAGWQLQYGREDAELGTVDYEKFPRGVRGVADAAHDRGFSVILYLGIGFIHDSPEDGGEWLALRGLIERYPDWLVAFQQASSPVQRYFLDFGNPDLRGYVGEVIREFFEVHGADGALIDGLADAEGQLIPREERDTPYGPPRPLLPSLDLYRFIRQEVDKHRPDAFVIGGWVNPTAAGPEAQIFFYADEAEHVHSPYPFGGFLEHLDYAMFSQMALGQRAYLGASSGDPNRPEARWWVQAGAALGAPATIGTRLERMQPATIATFRADLNALHPYEGVTTYGPGLFPNTFATTRDGVTYLGVVNRELRTRAMSMSLADHGLEPEAAYTALQISTGSGQRVVGDLTVEMPPRSFDLFVLRRDAGLVWTDSVTRGEVTANSLFFRAEGPAAIPGLAHIASPLPAVVLLDGVPLRGAERPQPDAAYAYDASSGLLSVLYSHRAGRRVEVRW